MGDASGDRARVEHLGLSVRALNLLMANDILFVDQVVISGLRALRGNWGDSAIHEITGAILRFHGIDDDGLEGSGALVPRS